MNGETRVTGSEAARRTPLYDLHVSLGARLVPFAGWAMPVQYPAGIIAEHKHTRAQAALFDVSHMRQVALEGDGAAQALEALVPGDIQALSPGRMRYTMFTNEQGGILDDLMVSNAGDHLHMVLNAARAEADLAHLRANLPDGVRLRVLDNRALLALQGPQAAAVLARLAPEAAEMGFMSARALDIAGIACYLSRSGYTGEDGFEISVPADKAEALARRLLDEPEVAPAGLGARDSLRLEAGLCLYGNDIDTATTPIEAGLAWTIGKRRRAEGGFPGAEIILRQLAEGPSRRRVGLRPEGKAPARAHTPVTDPAGNEIGVITSGGYGATVEGPVAMGYVAAAHAADGTEVRLVVRGRELPARVEKLPFVPHRYVRGK